MELDKDSVIIQDEDYSGSIFGYISVRGGYLFENNSPFQLKNIKSNAKTYLSINEYEALNKLFLDNQEGQNSLECWVKKIISNKRMRFYLIEKMSKKSLLPSNVPWKVWDIKVNGNNIY